MYIIQVIPRSVFILVMYMCIECTLKGVNPTLVQIFFVHEETTKPLSEYIFLVLQPDVILAGHLAEKGRLAKSFKK